jgi:hypothetical protein
MASKEAPVELLEENIGVAEAVCPLCGDMEPNDELLEAFDEVERMKRDPSLRRGCPSTERLFAKIRANVGD